MYVVFAIDTRTPIAWFFGKRDAEEFCKTRFRCDYEAVDHGDLSELMTIANRFIMRGPTD